MRGRGAEVPKARFLQEEKKMTREDLPKIVTGSVPGPKAKAILERRNQAVPQAMCGSTYPICAEEGAGAILQDVDGNEFLDWVGGVGVLNIGYSNPEVVEAVKKQADKYFHGIFNVYPHEGYVHLAEMFDETMPVKGADASKPDCGIKTYFANSGAEADENAIKIAKAYTHRENIICFSGAFHGRTNLTMALTAKKSYAKGMGPFPAGIYRAEYPYLYRAPKGYSREEALKYYLDGLEQMFDEASPAEEVAAILIEPLQGEGGFIPCPIEFAKKLREICDRYGIMLVADEVQCGNCRTGKYFCSEYWKDAGCAPDIIATAKSMGAGIPISAISARAEVMDAAPAGTIGGTFCGNPLACAAAIKTMEIMKRDDYAGKSMHIGELAMKAFEDMKDRYSVIGDVRGLGAMIGIEFVKDRGTKEPDGPFAAAMVRSGIQKGLLMENCGFAGQCIRFQVPLCATDEQLAAGFEIFEKCLKENL